MLFQNLKSLGVNHIAITGDLTNLSLGIEFALVRNLLLDSGFSSRDISIIPGNHDRYTKGSEIQRRFEAYLSPFMTSDPNTDCEEGTYPFIRLRNGVAIIGLNSALHQPFLVARGELGKEQIGRLRKCLLNREVRKRFMVFLIHHPPYRHPRKHLHKIEGLQDYEDFLATVSNLPSLILHGHLHKNIFFQIGSDLSPVLISGVSSSTLKTKIGKSNASSFIIYGINEGKLVSIERFILNRTKRTYERVEFDIERLNF